MEPPVDAFRPVTVALAYRLGEKRLGAVRLAGLGRATHYSRMEPYADLPDPGQESGQEAAFYFYPSYPVTFEPRRVERRGPWLVYTPYTFENHYIDLRATGSFDAYLKQFSSKSRSTLVRKVRKFEEGEGGRADWRQYSTSQDVGTFLDLAAPLAAGTYQARLIGNALPSSATFRARALERAAAGEVRAFLLFRAGRPIAYLFCFVTDGIATYDFVGYDPAESAASPGTILQYFALQALFADPACAMFDFTEGEGAQKAFFGREARRCAKSYFLRRSVRAIAVIRGHQALAWASDAFGATLDRLGLKDRLRRLLRRNA